MISTVGTAQWWFPVDPVPARGSHVEGPTRPREAGGSPVTGLALPRPARPLSRARPGAVLPSPALPRRPSLALKEATGAIGRRVAEGGDHSLQHLC